MKRMKVRGIAMTCALIGTVLAAGVVAPTLAWLSDSSETVTNTFKSESISVTVTEAQVEPETGKAQENAPRVVGNDYKVVAGRVLDKDPTPTIAKGSVPCAVYVKVTNGNASFFTPNYDTTNWTKISGDDTSAVYRYNEVVNAYTAQEDVDLEPIFEEVKVSDAFTGIEGNVEITVQAYAVQAEGLVSGDDFTGSDAQAVAFFNN